MRPTYVEFHVGTRDYLPGSGGKDHSSSFTQARHQLTIERSRFEHSAAFDEYSQALSNTACETERDVLVFITCATPVDA